MPSVIKRKISAFYARRDLASGAGLLKIAVLKIARTVFMVFAKNVKMDSARNVMKRRVIVLVATNV